MAISTTCICGKQIKVDDKFAGKRGRCSECGNVLIIPSLPVETLDTTDGVDSSKSGKQGRDFPIMWVGLAAFCIVVIGIAVAIDQKSRKDRTNDLAESKSNELQKIGHGQKEIPLQPENPPALTNSSKAKSAPNSTGKKALATTQPIPADVFKLDPIVKFMFEGNSDKYNILGFRGYEFGTTSENLRKRIKAGEEFKNKAWISAEKAALFMSDDHLFGVQARYVSSDINGYIDALKEEFGLASSDAIVDFSTVKVPNYNFTRRGFSRIKYKFDRVTAYAIFGSSDTLGPFVLVQVFDREYLESLFNENLKQKRELFDDLREVAEYCDLGNIDWEHIPLPRYPGMTNTNGRGGPRDLYRHAVLIGTSDKGSEGGIFADEALAVFESDEQGETKLVVRMDMNRFPHFVKHPLLTVPGRDLKCSGVGTVAEDNQTCNRMLAELYFPPKGRTIKVIDAIDDGAEMGQPVGLTKRYSWDTESGWKVVVANNNTIILLKGQRKSLQ